MTFSAIIPTCDRPVELVRALGSVLEQEAPPDEVIVVDNGRKPLAEQTRERFSKVRFLRIPPRSGVSVARNWGAMHATGDYLAFLDDDDLWSSNYLKEMAGCLAEAPGVALVAAPTVDLETSEILEQPADLRSAKSTMRWRKLGYVGSNIVVRRDLFWEAGGFPSSLSTGEDRALVIRLALSGKEIRRCDSTRVLKSQVSPERLTDPPTLALGKLQFLLEFGDAMNRADRDEDRFSVLVNIGRAWRWPLWIVGVFFAPKAAFRRGKKILLGRLMLKRRPSP